MGWWAWVGLRRCAQCVCPLLSGHSLQQQWPAIRPSGCLDAWGSESFGKCKVRFYLHDRSSSADRPRRSGSLSQQSWFKRRKQVMDSKKYDHTGNPTPSSSLPLALLPLLANCACWNWWYRGKKGYSQSQFFLYHWHEGRGVAGMCLHQTRSKLGTTESALCLLSTILLWTKNVQHTGMEYELEDFSDSTYGLSSF